MVVLFAFCILFIHKYYININFIYFYLIFIISSLVFLWERHCKDEGQMGKDREMDYIRVYDVKFPKINLKKQNISIYLYLYLVYICIYICTLFFGHSFHALTFILKKNSSVIYAFFLIFIFFFSEYVCHSVHIEVRGQIKVANSLLPHTGSASVANSLPCEPSCSSPKHNICYELT